MTRHLIAAAATTLMLGASMAHADTVEINLIDMLDNIQDGYCLDISGGQGADVDPNNGLQAHTCYSPSGEIFVDQGFDSEQFADGVLYMPEFDVCAEVASTEVGASVGLAACDGSAAQSFVFAGEGTITSATATDMCLTVAEATRTGRSETNQIKVLTLETCSDALAASQTWGNRTAD